MRLSPPRAAGLTAGFAAALAASLTLGLASCATDNARDDGVIQVPAEAATLTEAEELAEPGDMILIAPGNYEEQLLITTPDVTVRGEDRGETVIDGGGVRPFGIVAMADGVRVENLTVTDATFYGLLFTGLHDETGPSAPTVTDYEPWDPAEFPPLERFLADHVTATNNGLYGIYAFNARHGVIRDSYASGSADSGLYIGQCTECDILVTGNVAERNAVGFENSNASDSVMIAGNRFTGNRIGMTLLSSYQEAFLPQKGNTVVGNLIADNAETETPAQAWGGFATGIGISGGVGNLVARNSITGHERAGVILNNAEDLAALENTFIDNEFESNSVDVANTSADRAPAFENCVTGGSAPTTLPESLSKALFSPDGCDAAGETDPMEQPAAAGDSWEEAPAGISFRQVALPVAQPNLPQADSYPTLPDRVEMPDPDAFDVPTSDLLTDLAGAQ